MQDTSNNCLKQGSYVSAPMKGSLYGLDHPAIQPQLLDSTRLKDEPGGAKHPLTPGVNHTKSSGPKAPQLSYRDVTRSGLPRTEILSKEKVTDAVSSVVEAHFQAGPGWEMVRHGKNNRSAYWESSSVTSIQSYQSNDRNFPLTRKPLPIKRNSLANAGNRQPPPGRRPVKKPPGHTALVLPGNSSKIIPCTLQEELPINNVTNVKREFLEIWWQILGFTGQRGPMKQDKFIKVIIFDGE
ncbi:hypothetical protein RSAG8_11361, partial [Rhizoctonia solani AG-8 WAC10335]